MLLVKADLFSHICLLKHNSCAIRRCEKPRETLLNIAQRNEPRLVEYLLFFDLGRESIHY